MEHSEGGDQNQQQQPWGKLIRLGADEAEPHVLLLKREWTIGRKKGCDLSFPGNKLVSGDHCKITVDEESGQVSLEDTSTNGTVINKLKVVKKQTCPLQTGDVIYVVYRKNEPENNVAYLYESFNAKQDVTQEPVEANVENTCHLTKDTSHIGRSDDGTQITSSLPATQSCYEEPQPSTSTSNLFNASSTSLIERASAEQDNPSTSEPRCPGASHEEQGQLYANSETSTITSSIIDKERNESSTSEPQREEEEDLEPAKKKIKGGYLQPCMHTFCAACYSGWMERSSLCPTCRCPVERICKNHILNNLVEAYLIQHPGKLEVYLIYLHKCRNEEDVRSMDARNKITQDMLQPKVRRSFSDEEGSSEDLLELSDVDSESSDISQPYIVCRQCPGYRRHSIQPLPCPGQEGEAGGLQALGDAPSTSADFPTKINLGDKCLDGILNNNHYESDILKDYLASRGFTWKNMLNESLLALQREVFMLSGNSITFVNKHVSRTELSEIEAV
ncbi:E3 ubiquitin-protein ligase CHFR [Chelonia mydas]|uniref:E3 ubiquitin-protein ligase CHFR n=1 Tax=Chelonia mydas TaxID=8469 RepID=M7BSX2_CHEMY|nr:E3 ubiquitin-protein ligase CHFR [Chelonia mydas]